MRQSAPLSKTVTFAIKNGLPEIQFFRQDVVGDDVVSEKGNQFNGTSFGIVKLVAQGGSLGRQGSMVLVMLLGDRMVQSSKDGFFRLYMLIEVLDQFIQQRFQGPF